MNDLSDFDSRVDALFDYIYGELIGYEMLTVPHSGESTQVAGSYFYFDTSYKLTSSNIDYLVGLGSYPYNSIEPKRTGIEWMYIINSKDYDDEELYYGDGSQTPGLHFDVLPEQEYVPNQKLNAVSIINTFVDAVNAGDKTALEQVFSEKTRERAGISADAERLLEYVGGKITSFDAEIDNGKTSVQVDESVTMCFETVVYSLKTESDNFRIYLFACTANSQDSGEEGVRSVHIVRDADVKNDDPHGDFLNGKTDLPYGIYFD